MVAAVSSHKSARRGLAARKHRLYEYRVTVLSNKRLSQSENSEKELSLNHFRKLFGDDVRVVAKPKDEAEIDSNLDRKAFEPDARARMILRGLEIAEADLADAGGTYNLQQVVRLLRVTRQRVERKVQEGSLLAVPGPSNRRVYPTMQFNRDGSVVEGLALVREALGFSNSWSVVNFLINPNDGLDGARPIEVLREGEIDKVVAVAHSVGVQGH